MKTRRKSSSKAASASTVKITSYNVLSSHLSGASHFKACKPEFLEPSFRFNELLKKLESEVEDNAVICLQEISTPWAGKLHTFFASKGYYLVTGLYGSKFNGYMGVGIAFPTETYVAEEVSTTRIADTKRMPKKDKPTGFFNAVCGLLNSILSLVLSVAKFLRLYCPAAKEDLWDNVTYRYNQMICMRLRHKQSDKLFVVGNYHMPCMFRLPSVMMAHCALSAQHLQRFANGDPHVFAGDFNIKPDSTMYRLMTQGSVEKANPDYPQSVKGDSWECSIAKPFRSAYVAATGREPDFTNYAQVQDDPVFCETLDYLFISEEWTVDRVLALPDRSEVVGPFPTELEPSDHILISAHLSLN